LTGVYPLYHHPARMEGGPVPNTLFYGDNLVVLRNREHFPDSSVDLIYLDPPFNSQATYNVLFRGPTGQGSGAQIEAFEDTWHWGEAAEDAFDQDTGIDGKVFFKPDGKRTDVAIVSVKSGGVGVNMVRELKSVIEREKAPMGLFLTLDPPTGPMREEATAAEFYETLWGKHPRMQILTIAELLDGKRPDMPLVDVAAAFRPAPRESQEGEQHELTV
jgi:hypothetical protein